MIFTFAKFIVLNMLGAVMFLSACSVGDESSSSGADSNSRPSSSGNVRIKSIDDAVKRIPKISGCKWRSIVLRDDSDIGLRFCNTNDKLSDPLTIADVRKQEFFETMVASYSYNRIYEGFKYHDFGGVYNGFVVRLNSISERTKAQYLAEVGLPRDRLDVLLSRDENEVRLDHLRFRVDSAYFWSEDVFEYSMVEERYLMAFENNYEVPKRGRLSEYGRNKQATEKEEEEAKRRANEVAEAAERERAREQTVLANARAEGKLLILRGGVSGGDFGSLQFPWMFPASFSKFKGAADFLWQPTRSAAYPLGYFNILLKHKNNVTGTPSPSEIANIILDSEDRRLWRYYLGTISIGRQELVNDVYEYRDGTVFEKNANREALYGRIFGLISDDIESFSKTTFYLPIEGHMTMRYDFDQNAFVPIDSETYFKVRGAMGRQYRHGDNNLITEWVLENVLTSVDHGLDGFKIDIAANEAQDFVDKYAETTSKDNEFGFVFYMVFSERSFSVGRSETLENTGIEERYREFASGDFSHLVWESKCITLLKGQEFWTREYWPQSQHVTFAYGTAADAEKCTYLARIMDAYSEIKPN